MSNNAAEVFANLQKAVEATGGRMGWSIGMSPTGGGHTAQVFGAAPGIVIDYQPGSPAPTVADVIFLGRPFIPVTRPLILPLTPGMNDYSKFDINFGAGVSWTLGANGGAATLSWNFNNLPQCSNGWAIVDTVASPGSGMFQIACSPAPATWQLTVQIITVLDTKATVTLYADGVSQGTLQDGDQKNVTGKTISIGIEASFPTPSQDGMSIGYVLQQQ